MIAFNMFSALIVQPVGIIELLVSHSRRFQRGAAAANPSTEKITVW
jgi:hypothetical protein